MLEPVITYSPSITHAARSANSSHLQSRNVRIHNRRTSVRLEPAMWEALYEIAKIEGCAIHDICSAVSDCREDTASFTASLRVFLMVYYRSAALMDSRVAQVQTRLKEAVMPDTRLAVVS